MVGISHLQQPCLSTKWLDLIIMRKPNGESHTYACVTERQLSGKQFSIMYIRKRPYQVIRKSKLAGCNIPILLKNSDLFAAINRFFIWILVRHEVFLNSS
jgi:hypothetical protein